MCDIRTKPNDICYISLFRVTVPPGPRRLSAKRNIRYVHCQVSVFIVCIQKVELYKGWMVYESHYPLFLLFLKVSDEHDFNACLCWCFDEFLALSNYCAHCHWICNFFVWACFCLFDFVLELIGFVFRFEDLCCDYVQHNVLCNESEFSGVCVIQTVGSLVTRQGLNCFLCVSAFLKTTFGTLYIQMPGYHVPCTNISLYIYFHLAHPTLDQMIIHFFVVPWCLFTKHCEWFNIVDTINR